MAQGLSFFPATPRRLGAAFFASNGVDEGPSASRLAIEPSVSMPDIRTHATESQ